MKREREGLEKLWIPKKNQPKLARFRRSRKGKGNRGEQAS